MPGRTEPLPSTPRAGVGVDWRRMGAEDFDATLPAALPGVAVRPTGRPVTAVEHHNGTAALFGEEPPPAPARPVRGGFRKPADNPDQSGLF